MKRTLIALAVCSVAGLSAGSALALDRAGVDAVRDKAVKVVQDKGIVEGGKFLGDAANGLLDLKGTGLHTWAMGRKGIILFDHSGQTEPNMDISDLKTDKGEDWIPKMLKSIDKADGGSLDEPTAWPHPTTNALGNSYVSCKPVEKERKNFVCAMAWIK